MRFRCLKLSVMNNRLTSIIGQALLLLLCSVCPTPASFASATRVMLSVYPDSIISTPGSNALGINVNYLTDGDRYPDATPIDSALKAMNVKFLRYPGGEKSDLYMFSSFPYEISRPTVTRTVGLDQYPGMFSPHGELLYDPLDFDEFMSLCKSTGTEPVIVVAADRYDLPADSSLRQADREQMIEHAAAWVRYSNITKGYNIRYWMVGNESWNDNNPNSTAELYANDVIDFSEAMKQVDPGILIVANGDKEAYFQKVIEIAGDKIDRLCVSNYGVYDFFKGYDTYRDTPTCLVYPAMTAINAMKKYSTPQQLQRYKMIVAEFGTIDWFNHWKGINDMGHVIVTFDMIGQLLQLPEVEFSCFWNTRWIECGKTPLQSDHDAVNEKGELNPTGVALKLWNSRPIHSLFKIDSSDDSIVAFAATGSSSDEFYVYLLNKGNDAKSIECRLNVHGRCVPMHITEYHGKNPDDINPELCEYDIHSDTVELKGFSVNVIRYSMPESFCRYTKKN